jgi:AcrR family transcriptional regulator
MGRPREHDDTTAAALLAAAERILDEEGLQALSLRRLAEAADTTTRAVYSLFGSKDGLIVALSQRAFELLGAAIAELPASADPAADLVEAGVAVFRRFALDHASLFRLAVQQTLAPAELTGQARPAATAAMAGLNARIERLAAAGLLGERTIDAAACEFHALCEGLAAIELRGIIHDGQEAPIWRDALGAFVAGLALDRHIASGRRGGRGHPPR